jgi:mannose-6-phosphate isomerase-like protein (cupin superfamily)
MRGFRLVRHFQLIASGVDVLPLVHAVQRQPELFNRSKFRTTFENTPHGEIEDILIRFSDPSIARDGDTAAVMADGNCVWHEAAAALPQARTLILDVMRRLEAYAVDRIVITRLRPGGRILPHADNEGAYVHDPHRHRYHVVLQGLPGSMYRTGDETVCMRTGEVWHFDALTEHSVENNSTDSRIHMLVDLRIMP